ncbi:MAG TPA: O-antigen ligase domain-containing protein [Phycisphaerales bacterium]|nr:O-antigen ligase domain-containing protein [Phycisphaerales bacterium]
MLFALAAPLFAYAAMTHKNVSLKPFFLFALIITIGMALMTASRQTMLAVILVMLPVMLVLTKRPVMTVLGLGVAAIALPFILSLGAEADLQRYSSLETGRLDIWGAYFTEVFPKRPLFGLLGTSGQSYFKAINEVGQHPHNAWLYLMYIGGLSFAVPMIYLTVYSTYSGWMVWKYRNVLPGDPFLYSILIMILVAMYIQGLFNQVVYWPTYAWSFLHVVFASLFICMWRDIRDGNVQGALFEDYDPYSDEVEDDTEEFEEYQDYGRVVQRPTS